jgi:hypothetical protein
LAQRWLASVPDESIGLPGSPCHTGRHQRVKIGALGLQIAARHGRIHSETFADFSIADAMRPLLWTRIQSLAANHGIARLWTQEPAPFWTQTGFQPANDAVMAKLPEVWNGTGPRWFTLQLKDEEAIASLEKEFAMFMESEKQRSAQALDQAKTLKVFVTIFALLIAAGILAAALYVFIKHKSGGALPGP